MLSADPTPTAEPLTVKPGMLDAIFRADTGISPFDHDLDWVARYRRHAPGRDCPSCDASKAEHDEYGCLRTRCPMPR